MDYPLGSGGGVRGGLLYSENKPHRKRVSLKFCSYSILDPNFAREEWSHVHKSLQTGRYDTLTENLNEL